MTFASTISNSGVPNVVGDKKIQYGTYTSSDSGTGGNIDTGLTVCERLILQPTGSTVGTNAPKVNETFPCAGSAVTIVTDADEAGIWEAWGT